MNALRGTTRSQTSSLASAPGHGVLLVESSPLERGIDAGVEPFQEDTIRRWVLDAESGDKGVVLHVERMSRYSAILARRLGMDEARCEEIRLATQLHDVGKSALPASILTNPALLTEEEREVAEEHCEIGHRILSGSESPLLDLAAEIALTHHERVDGTGYPHGLLGSEIPPAGRIAAIADVFDALTTDRPYRPAWSVQGAVEFMSSERGTHFNHALLDRFFEALPEVLRVKEQYADPATTQEEGRGR